jgi:hypothetical protein
MARAWQIVTFFKAHALHAYSLMGADAVAELAQRILTWLRERGLKQFTRVDAYRRFQADTTKASDIDAPLAVLEDRHYIRREPDPPRPRGTRGRNPRPTFTVNPLWQK